MAGHEKLTGNLILPLRNPVFVPSSCRSQSLVCGCDGDYSDEGEDKASVTANVPPAEDDAEVFGVPGEEHLRRVGLACCSGRSKGSAGG